MRIVPKLTIALVAGMCVVLGVNGYFRVRRETAAFEAERRHRHRRAAASMSAAMSAVWATEGEEGALATMNAMETGFPSLDAAWRPLGSAPHVSSLATSNSATPEPVTIVDAEGEGGTPTWRTYAPVVVDGRTVGAVELLEVATADEENARDIVGETVKMAAVLAALSAVLAFLLGDWVVGRPVRALGEQARRIGRGEFGVPVEIGTADELADLAREMNAMSERLVTTLEQLRHADRLATVGKLAAGIAHELGTPLNIVSARAEMIAAGRTSPEEGREYARVIGDAANRMTGIIRQVLQFARRRSVKRASEDVAAIVRDAVDLVRPLLRRREVTVEVEVEAETVRAHVDRAQLHQVVTNLVMNAAQASRERGHIVVRVETTVETPPADVGGDACDAVCIDVEDEGSGIAPADVPRVFEPFFTTKDVGEGTGLGLAVSYGIVRDHQGWITVRSELGVGSTFRVVLPLVPAG